MAREKADLSSYRLEFQRKGTFVYLVYPEITQIS